MRWHHVLRTCGHGNRAKLLLALVVPVSVVAALLLATPAPADASAGTIVQNGPPVTASVTTPGQTSVVTFTGNAGETLSLRAANWTFPADGGTTLRVVNSASRTVGPTGRLNGTGVVTLEPIALPAAGQYSVVVDPSKLGDVGSVQLTLTDIGSVTPGGAAVTASVGTAGQVGLVSFHATAGELVGVQVSNSTFPADWLTTMTITSTSGAAQGSVVYLNGGSTPFLGPVRLAAAGTYEIVVNPTNGTDVGSAQLTVSAFADSTGSITPNGPAVTAAVTVPGQRAILSFSATAGQELGIQASGSTFPDSADPPRFYIADSAGQEIGGDNYIYEPPVVNGPIIVPAAGTYQLVVDPGPDSAATGTVSVKLVSFTDQTGTLTPDGPAVTADITAPAQRAIYSFSGTAGQKLVASYTSSTFTLDSDVLDVTGPTGTDLAQIPVDTPTGTTPAFTLPAAGTYQVIVDPTSQADTGSISLSLLSVNDIHAPITPGVPVDVSITTPGQRAFYSFTTATAGEQVNLTVADSTFTSNKDGLYVLDASGNGVGDTYFLADGTFGPITLGPPGTYQVVIDPAAYDQNDTGTLTLTLTPVTPPAAQASAILGSDRTRPQAPPVRQPDHATEPAVRAMAASAPGASLILQATLTETITTNGCTDNCAGTSSDEVQTRTVNWTARSDGTSAGTVLGTDTDSGMANGPVCTFPYYSDSAAASSGTGTGDASISYVPDGANLDTYTIDLGAITGTTDTVANSIMAGHCTGILPPTPARSTSSSTTAGVLASDHTVTGEIADNAAEVTGHQDCGSGTTVTDDITLIATTTSCTISWHAQREISYAALGDSYSSGEGAGAYDPTPADCHRSAYAWPRLVAQHLAGLLSMPSQGLVACSGANSNALAGQVTGQPDQIAALLALRPRPTLITVTMGGNDIGFADVLRDCYVDFYFLRQCAGDDTLKAAAHKVAEETPILENDFREILQADPNASLLVVSYPNLFPPKPSDVYGCPWLSDADLIALNKLEADLNQKIDDAARLSGAKFANVTPALDGHEACTKDSWIYPIGRQDKSEGGYQQDGHPMEPGQQAIARLVAKDIKQLLAA
jgi:lysophospholipase L1-like esterase